MPELLVSSSDVSEVINRFSVLHTILESETIILMSIERSIGAECPYLKAFSINGMNKSGGT